MESIFFQKVNQPQLVLPKDKLFWQPILDKMIAADAKDRYQSAGDLINDLKNIDKKAEPIEQNSTQRNLYASIAAISVIFISVAAYFSLSPSTQESFVTDPVSDAISTADNTEASIQKTLLTISSKIQVPYDQNDCNLNVREDIDFVPYLGEDLYENNCFGVSA